MKPMTKEMNMRSTDFLEVTLNLKDGSQRPQQDLISSKEIFDKEKPIYQKALKNAGFKENLEYEKPRRTRRRRRSILCVGTGKTTC